MAGRRLDPIVPEAPGIPTIVPQAVQGALTSVFDPDANYWDGDGVQDDPDEPEPPAEAPPKIADSAIELRVNLTRPHDRDNELVSVAAMHGAPGILAVLRTRKDYAWVVELAFRAIEICLSQRHPADAAVLRECDPIEFALQMHELEMIDEIFQIMEHYEHLMAVQRSGLAIIETLVMDDISWRDEVARKGGVALLCMLARAWEANPVLLGQVMTCMSYLAAEDYIEVMLCQHGALELVVNTMNAYMGNADLMTRASLALLNLTVCEPHVEELMDREFILTALSVMDAHPFDVNLVIMLCGVLANFSVMEEVREVLALGGMFKRIHQAMKLEPQNAVLQVACLKALVNFSTSTEHYLKMDELDLPAMVGRTMVNHPRDAGVQKYGNYFLGEHTSCPIS
jgi:hypothetical protein